MILRKFSDEELELEIQRRRRWRDEHTPKPFPNCDECSHFITFVGDMDSMPENYNPCERGHKMSFRMPDGPTSQEWGFYRPGCKDREPSQFGDQRQDG